MRYEIQKCPRCNGAGCTNKPPWLPGDQNEWTSSGAYAYTCPACSGKGILLVEQPYESYIISKVEH